MKTCYETNLKNNFASGKSNVDSNEHVFSQLLCSLAPQGILLVDRYSLLFFLFFIGRWKFPPRFFLSLCQRHQRIVIPCPPLVLFLLFLGMYVLFFGIGGILGILAQVIRPVKSSFSVTLRWVDLYFIFQVCLLPQTE